MASLQLDCWLKAFTLCNLERNGNETGETILYFVLHSVISAPDSPALHHLFYRYFRQLNCVFLIKIFFQRLYFIADRKLSGANLFSALEESGESGDAATAPPIASLHCITSCTLSFEVLLQYDVMELVYQLSHSKIMMGYYFLDLRNQVLKGQKYKFWFSQHFEI